MNKVISFISLIIISIALNLLYKEYSFSVVLFIVSASAASLWGIFLLGRSLVITSDQSQHPVTLSEATTEAKQADALGVDFCCGACRGE